MFAVAALGIGTVCSAQTESKTVTYSTVAKTADKVIADIAAQTGEQLEVTKDALSHVLVLHVVDVPLEELLDRIATVTSSRWTKESDGRRTLRPDQPLRRRLAREAQRERAAAIQQSITKIQEQLQEAGEREYGTGANMMFGPYGPMSTPGSMAVARLTGLLRAADVAALDEGQRIVYSTSPNRMQRSLTGNVVNSVLNTLVEEHNTWFRSTAEKREQERLAMLDQFSEMGIDSAFFEMMTAGQVPKLIDASVAEALLVVEQGSSGMFGMFSGTSVSLSLLDANGNVLLSEEMSLGSQYFDFEELAAMTGDEVEAEEDEGEEEVDETDTALVTFRDMTVKVARATQRFSFEEDLPEIAPDVLQVIMSPVQYEPLAFAESDGLLAVAKAKGWNLVANVPDDLDISRLALSEGTTTVRTVLAIIEGVRDVDTMLDGDWYSLMPARPVESLNERVDRAAVQTYVSRVKARGYASLDDMAFLASQMSEEASKTHAAQAIYLSGHPTEQNMMAGEGLWETLRLWGMLSAGVKQSLMRGGSINFSQLGTAARNQVSKMAYGTDANLMPLQQLAKERTMTPFDRLFARQMAGRGGATYLSEPTEVMPAGLPGAGSITINVTTGGLAVSENPAIGEMAFFQSVGAEEIAFIQFMMDAADEAGEDIGIPELGSFKIGVRNKLEIVFHLSQEAVMTRTLNDDSLEPGASVVRLTNLPPEFAAEVSAFKALIAKSPFASMMMMGFGGDQRIEPPE